LSPSRHLAKRKGIVVDPTDATSQPRKLCRETFNVVESHRLRHVDWKRLGVTSARLRVFDLRDASVTVDALPALT